MTDKMHYFRPVKGRAVRRCGSNAFIGATRGPKGYTWNTDVVVAITEREMRPYRKDYVSSVRHGDLKRATKTEYEAWLNKRQAATEEAKKKRDEAKAKAEADAEKKAEAVAPPDDETQDDSDASASEATGGSAA